MKLLVFEYATASGIDDPEIFLEGRSMLEALLADFRDFDVEFLLSERFADMDIGAGLRPSLIGDLDDWLQENLEEFDACIFIAAEEDMELYRLTRLVEESGVLLLGSSADAVRTCSDKRLTYRALEGRVPLIRTYEPGEVDVAGSRLIVKPADGVACQGIRILEPGEAPDFSDDVIIQDFIEGESVSVSLLSDGERALPMSLNRQDIMVTGGELGYCGGSAPLDHGMREDAFTVARRAVESIPGLRGYVGVDLILADEPYLVEINSRITTPYIGLRRVSEANLGHLILEAVLGRLPSGVKFNGTASFRKGTDGMVVEVNEGFSEY